MKRLVLVITAILYCAPSYATSHWFVSDGTTLHVISDGLRTFSIGDQTQPICKLRTGGDAIFISAGMTMMEAITVKSRQQLVPVGKPTVYYNYDALAIPILNSPMTLNAKFDRLRAAALQTLQEELDKYMKVPTGEDKRSITIIGALLWMENNQFLWREFDIRVNWNTGKVFDNSTDETQPLMANHLYHVPHFTSGAGAPEEEQVRERFTLDGKRPLDSLLTVVMKYDAAHSKGSVGPPYASVVLSKSGVRWLEGHELCAKPTGGWPRSESVTIGGGPHLAFEMWASAMLMSHLNIRSPILHPEQAIDMEKARSSQPALQAQIEPHSSGQSNSRSCDFPCARSTRKSIATPA